SRCVTPSCPSEQIPRLCLIQCCTPYCRSKFMVTPNVIGTFEVDVRVDGAFEVDEWRFDRSTLAVGSEVENHERPVKQTHRAPGGEWVNADRYVRQFADFGQVAQLRGHNSRAADNAV